jgi:hypothetical protein
MQIVQGIGRRFVHRIGHVLTAPNLFSLYFMTKKTKARTGSRIQQHRVGHDIISWRTGSGWHSTHSGVSRQTENGQRGHDYQSELLTIYKFICDMFGHTAAKDGFVSSNRIFNKYGLNISEQFVKHGG